MKRLLAVLFCIAAVTSCAPRYATWPSLIKHSGPDELDPAKATFEEHIFALSVLRSAVPTSQEYRARLQAGYRHPKTLARDGEEFVYIPKEPRDKFNPFAHAYLLDRSAGKFTLFCYWPGMPQMPRRQAYFRDNRGWWLEDPFPPQKLTEK